MGLSLLLPQPSTPPTPPLNPPSSPLNPSRNRHRSRSPTTHSQRTQTNTQSHSTTHPHPAMHARAPTSTQPHTQAPSLPTSLTPPITPHPRTTPTPTTTSPVCNATTPTHTIPVLPPPPHPPLITSYPITALSIPPSITPSPPPHTISLHNSKPKPGPSKSINILQWNAGGIRARHMELSHFLSLNPFDLLLIQESNLDSNTRFAIQGYHCIRADRKVTRGGSSTRTSRPGGGVLTLVRKGLSHSIFSTDSLSKHDPSSDYLGITLHIDGSPPYTFSTYILLPFAHL